MPIDADGPRIALEPGHDGKTAGDMAVLSARGDVDSLDSTCERRRHLSATGLVLLFQSKIMRFQKPVSMLLSLSIVTISPMTLFPAPALAEVVCSGHKLLPMSRPESSCSNVKPMIYASPDGALRALVLAVDVSLYATPDMESRVVIRTSKGDTVTSKDYSSPRGTNGYYVVNAKWSPDSQFFVYSMASSGGHSPWSFPMMVYSRQKKRIVEFSDMIEGKPMISAGFHFVGPHTLVATTWKAPGALDDKVPVTVDLQDAFGKLPESSD
jgi:hypothetical protein